MLLEKLSGAQQNVAGLTLELNGLKREAQNRREQERVGVRVQTGLGRGRG